MVANSIGLSWRGRVSEISDEREETDESRMLPWHEECRYAGDLELIHWSTWRRYKAQADARPPAAGSSHPERFSQSCSAEQNEDSERRSLALIGRPGLQLSTQLSSRESASERGAISRFPPTMAHENEGTPSTSFFDRSAPGNLTNQMFQAWINSPQYKGGNFYAGLNHQSSSIVLQGNSDPNARSRHYFGPTMTGGSSSLIQGDTTPQVAAQIAAQQQQQMAISASGGRKLGSNDENDNQAAVVSISPTITAAEAARLKWGSR